MCLVGAQTGALLWIAWRHSYFLGGDPASFRLSRTQPFWSFSFSPIDVHFVPLHELTSYLVYRIAPMRFELARAVLAAAHAVTLWFLARAIHYPNHDVAKDVRVELTREFRVQPSGFIGPGPVEPPTRDVTTWGESSIAALRRVFERMNRGTHVRRRRTFFLRAWNYARVGEFTCASMTESFHEAAESIKLPSYSRRARTELPMSDEARHAFRVSMLLFAVLSVLVVATALRSKPSWSRSAPAKPTPADLAASPSRSKSPASKAAQPPASTAPHAATSADPRHPSPPVVASAPPAKSPPPPEVQSALAKFEHYASRVKSAQTNAGLTAAIKDFSKTLTPPERVAFGRFIAEDDSLELPMDRILLMIALIQGPLPRGPQRVELDEVLREVKAKLLSEKTQQSPG